MNYSKVQQVLDLLVFGTEKSFPHRDMGTIAIDVPQFLMALLELERMVRYEEKMADAVYTDDPLPGSEKRTPTIMDIQTARGIAARIWCDPDYEHVEMNVDLAERIAVMLQEEEASSRIRNGPSGASLFENIEGQEA